MLKHQSAYSRRGCFSENAFPFSLSRFNQALLVAILFIASSSFAQDPEQDDKYQFDRRDFIQTPNTGLDVVSSLLADAVSQGAPETAIAKLRVENAIMAINCHESKDKWQVAIESLEPVISDPSPLFGELEAAKLYVEAVYVWHNALSQMNVDAAAREETMQRAIVDLDSAMALTDRERFMLEGYVRSLGSDFSFEKEDYEGAIEWLRPLIEGQNILTDDSYGAELLNLVTRQQSKSYAKLGRMIESTSVVENGVATLYASRGLAEPRKLRVIGYLLACQLLNFSNHVTDPGAEDAWQDVDEQLAKMETFRGPELIDVQLTILEMHRARITYLGARDLERSIQVAEQMLAQFDRHQEVATSKTAYHHANDYAISVLTMLREANHPRERELRERIVAFETKYGQNPPSKEPGRIE